MRPIPFKLPEINHGLTEGEGQVSLDEEFVVFEIVTAFLGEFAKERQVIKIEPEALEEVWLEYGFLNDKIMLRPKKRDLLDAMPGEYWAELPMKVKRKRRVESEAFVEALQRRLRRAGTGE